MDDVVFGYVYDFGTGEEWTATRGGGALLNGAPIDRAPEGRARDPLVRGDDDRLRLRERRAVRRRRAPPARDGVARDHALPPRRRARRRRRLAEGGAVGRHRRRAAARPRARPRDRPARRAAVRHARRSTWSGVHASSPRATSSCAAGWRTRSRGKNRLLGLELRPLAARRLLPAALCRPNWLAFYARHFDTVEVNMTFYRLAEGADRAALGARDAARLRLRRQGQPLHHAHQAPARRATSTCRSCSTGSSRSALAEARPAPLAAAADVPASISRGSRRRSSTRGTSGTGMRSSSGIRAWFSRRDVCAASRAQRALVIGDRPEVNDFQAHELTADFTFVRFHGGTRGRERQLLARGARRMGRAACVLVAQGRRVRLLQQRLGGLRDRERPLPQAAPWAGGTSATKICSRSRTPRQRRADPTASPAAGRYPRLSGDARGDPAGARPGDRPGAAQARDRARHGPRRADRRRRT